MPSQRDRVDPELRGPLEAMPRNALDYTDIPKARDTVRRMAAQADVADDPSVAIEQVAAVDGDRSVAIRLFRPLDVQDALPITLWFHGGGMVAGFAAQEDAYLKLLAKGVGCAVASIEYRLAPEHRPPAAVEDGLLAYSWLAANAGSLGCDPGRIGIAGASGGGGIAAALALIIRDRGAPAPLFQALNFPMLDDRLDTPSAREITDIGIVDRHSFEALWAAVLGDRRGGADVSPYAAPARAERLDGVAPAFIAVGELDVVRDEAMAYAARLTQAGVATEFHLYPGAPHNWDDLGPEAAVSKAFTAAWHGYLRRRFDSERNVR